MPEPIRDYIITGHTLGEMSRRGLDESTLRQVMINPEQRHNVRLGRDVLQARIEFGPELYLLRVFVDVERSPAEVVTVYRTSKIAK